MNQTDAAEADHQAPSGDLRPERHPEPDRRLYLQIAIILLIAFVGVRFSRFPTTELNNDPGIQFGLSEATARGEIPIRDFEHGWNSGIWYVGALLYLLAAGNATIWFFLWSHVFAELLTGALLLALLWRLRIRGVWLLVFTSTFLLVSSAVINVKYALPAVWLFALARSDSLSGALGGRQLRRAVFLRALLAATTFWVAVDLAGMLAGGLAVYEVVGALHRPLRQRLLLAASAVGGVFIGLAVQAVAYLALGVATSRLIRHLLLDPSATYDDFQFGYPLGRPPDIRTLLFPVAVVLPFAFSIWGRLRTPTRLAACLQLGLSLVAIRRTDVPHVAVASSLVAITSVLVVHDLAHDGGLGLVRSIRGWSRAWRIVGGATWFAVAIMAGFNVEHSAAVGLMTLVCVGAAWMGRRQDGGWSSVGTLLMVVVFLIASVGSKMRIEVNADDSGQTVESIAAEAIGLLEACAPSASEVWIVPGPLGLYRELDVTNPTPWVKFQYGFSGQHERVRKMITDERVPVILSVNNFPVSFGSVRQTITAQYTNCGETIVAATGDRLRVWTYEGRAP